MKKLLVFAFLFMFAFQSMSLAAVSGSKGATSAPRAPRVSQPTPSPTAPSQAAPGYKPSAPANSYNDKAPAPTARPQQPQAPQSTGNSFLRTAAMIGGGMLLGSMLGNMFGFGSNAMMSQIAGIILNILILGLVFMVGRYLWMRFRAGREQPNVSRLN